MYLEEFNVIWTYLLGNDTTETYFLLEALQNTSMVRVKLPFHWDIAIILIYILISQPKYLLFSSLLFKILRADVTCTSKIVPEEFANFLAARKSVEKMKSNIQLDQLGRWIDHGGSLVLYKLCQYLTQT